MSVAAAAGPVAITRTVAGLKVGDVEVKTGVALGVGVATAGFSTGLSSVLITTTAGLVGSGPVFALSGLSAATVASLEGSTIDGCDAEGLTTAVDRSLVSGVPSFTIGGVSERISGRISGLISGRTTTVSGRSGAVGRTGSGCGFSGCFAGSGCREGSGCGGCGLGGKGVDGEVDGGGDEDEGDDGGDGEGVFPDDSSLPVLGLVLVGTWTAGIAHHLNFTSSSSTYCDMVFTELVSEFMVKTDRLPATLFATTMSFTLPPKLVQELHPMLPGAVCQMWYSASPEVMSVMPLSLRNVSSLSFGMSAFVIAVAASAF